MNLFGFNSSPSLPANSLHTIDAHTLKEWLDQNSIVLVDVREPNEHATGYIPGATLVPLSRFDAQRIPQSSNQKIVLYCRSGQRSTMAAQRLFNAGYKDVTHLENGIGGWIRAGYTVQIG